MLLTGGQCKQMILLYWLDGKGGIKIFDSTYVPKDCPSES